jgi:hypothetical protein
VAFCKSSKFEEIFGLDYFIRCKKYFIILTDDIGHGVLVSQVMDYINFPNTYDDMVLAKQTT